MINSEYPLVAKNNKGEGMGGKRKWGLITFFPRKGGKYERGGLTEDLRYLPFKPLTKNQLRSHAPLLLVLSGVGESPGKEVD